LWWCSEHTQHKEQDEQTRAVLNDRLAVHLRFANTSQSNCRPNIPLSSATVLTTRNLFWYTSLLRFPSYGPTLTKVMILSGFTSVNNNAY
jgi:hypothetical protein